MIVDGANVMGSRADGWWRDRAGAMARLYGELVGLAARGVPGEPPWPGAQGGSGRWWPQIVLVVEGRASAAIGLVTADPRVRIVPAPGHGDDAIAAEAASAAGRRLVVTADRELRRRCMAAGAEVAGPRWLTGLLDPPESR